jgi:ATP/maltotriose-dependent transcriptional regulator MalT
MELLRSAERDARRMEKEKTVYGDGMAQLVRAGIRATRGDNQQALALAASAEVELQKADMALYAAAARYRRGQLVGGAEGKTLMTESESWLSNQKIRNCRRMIDMLAPGIWPGTIAD